YPPSLPYPAPGFPLNGFSWNLQPRLNLLPACCPLYFLHYLQQLTKCPEHSKRAFLKTEQPVRRRLKSPQTRTKCYRKCELTSSMLIMNVIFVRVKLLDGKNSQKRFRKHDT